MPLCKACKKPVMQEGYCLPCKKEAPQDPFPEVYPDMPDLYPEDEDTEPYLPEF